VLLGVLPRADGIVAAGGLIVEALPGTANDILAGVEQNVHLLDGVSVSLEAGGVGALIESVLGGQGIEVLERQPLRYECRCRREALRERLETLSDSELKDLFQANESCEAVCAFCGDRYIFRAEELLLPRSPLEN
jgi:molecular chaperone Hsp33